MTVYQTALPALLLLAACATGPDPGPVRVDPNAISREEIDQEGPSSAYRLIQKLRPAWLRGRGATSFTQESPVVVYQDGTRLGGPDELRPIDTQNVERLEFLDARRATLRFGAGHVNGAILVVMRGGSGRVTRPGGPPTAGPASP